MNSLLGTGTLDACLIVPFECLKCISDLTESLTTPAWVPSNFQILSKWHNPSPSWLHVPELFLMSHFFFLSVVSIKCVCLKIHWRPNAQCNGIWKRDLWSLRYLELDEVTRQWWWWWGCFPGCKNVLVNAGDTRDLSLISGLEDPPEESMEILSSILSWRIPWTEEPGGL